MIERKKRITMIVGHLTNNSIIHDLAIGLSNEFDITVITGFPSRRVGSEGVGYYINNPIERVNKNYIIKRFGSKKGEGNNFFSRTIKYVLLSKKLIKEAVKEKTDIFYIYSTPPFLGYYAKKLSKRGLVLFNSQDIFPDSYISLKPSKRNSAFIKYLKRKEKDVYNNSNKIITISEQMKLTINKRIDEDKKVEVVKNWTDTKRYIPIEKEYNILYKKYNIDYDKFYIVYGGNIGSLQGWDLLIEVAKEISNEKINFLIFGRGNYEKILQEQIKRYDLKNIKLFPLQKEELAPNVYNLGDLCLVPLMKNMTNYAYPHKITNIISVGKPILGLLDYKSEIANEINKNNLGFVPENNIVKDVVDFIESVYNKEIVFNSENIRNYALKEFNREIQIDKYVNIISKMKEG